jgi:uncharacterized protein YndB with AHSA1/START domain
VATVRAKAGGTTLAAERGFLLIADISGYSEYVIEGPLEYAENVVAEMTLLVADRLRHSFQVNKLEGDAVFSYVHEVDSSMFLDTIEECYFAFRRRLEGMQHSTSCACKACTKLPDLDLKFVAHHGSFIRRPGPGGEELTGPDVILVHRFLKNAVNEVLDSRGYVLATEACVGELDIDPAAIGMLTHRETSSDIGETRAFVLDLDRRFREEKERRRVFVSKDEASFEVAWLFPAPPSVVWRYLTAPSERMRWREDVVEEASVGGRRLTGTRSYCVDGRSAVYEEILDWRPFDYFTEKRTFRGPASFVLTTELEATAEGTRVRTRGSRSRGARHAAWHLGRRKLTRGLRRGYARLAELIAANG